jgi:hypothetical protein
MKVKITRNTVAQGQAVNIGEVVELQKDEARLLIALGKAEGVDGSAPKTAVLPSAEKAVEIPAADKGKPKGKA